MAVISMQQIQAIDNQAAKIIEGRYPNATIYFSPSRVPDDKEKTYVQVQVSTKDGGLEDWFNFGVVAPNFNATWK